MVEKDLEQYLNEDLGSYPLIPEEEFIERLRAERQNPDKEERNKLVIPHMRLVRKIAREIYRKYKPRGVEVYDLVSEGFFGLEKAYDRFNSEVGVRFSSYASIWIKQVLLKHLSERGEIVRIPSTQLEKIKHLRYQRARIEQENGKPPTDEELEIATGYNKEKIRELSIYESLHSQISLDTKVFDDSEKSKLIDQIVDEREYRQDNEDIEDILSITEKLDEREKYILREKYVTGKTLDEIGGELGLTKERIRQIETKSLARLRGRRAKLRMMYDLREQERRY